MIAWLVQTERPRTGSLGVWNIEVMQADGSAQRRVTNDNFINSKPQWTPDGKTIYFHRFMLGVSDHWSLWSIGVDGTGLREVTPQSPGNHEYPSL